MKENGTMNWLEQVHQMKNRDIRTIEQSEPVSYTHLTLPTKA